MRPGTRTLPLALVALAACTAHDAPAPLAPRTDLGALTVAFTGLPDGVNGSASVSGPSGRIAVVGGQTLDPVIAGTYTVIGEDAWAGAISYGAVELSQTAIIPVSAVPETVQVNYVVMTGQLTVMISGLPPGLAPRVLVSGPFGYKHTITATGTYTLTGLEFGDYSVEALEVTYRSATYVAAASTAYLGRRSLVGAFAVAYDKQPATE